MSFLADLFYSDVRAELFRLLFGLHPERMYRLQIINQLSFAQRSVEEELEKLQKLELLVSDRDGNRVYYTPNRAHPLYPEIRNLVLKTVGLHDILVKALTHSDVQCAFVFGSVAALTETAESDVDLMVIGTLGERTLATHLRGVPKQIGREINPHLFTPTEVARRTSENDHFFRDILSKPKIFLIGDQHVLDQLAQRRVDSTSSVQS